MNPWKSSLIVLVVLGSLAGSAQAQQGNAPFRGNPTYPGAGTNGDYYSITNNYGNYGLPGTYPKYQGYGLSGYGPGSILNEYFVPWPGPGVKPATPSQPAPARASVPKPTRSKASQSRVAPKAMPAKKPTGK
jgi:hypothetical protein